MNVGSILSALVQVLSRVVLAFMFLDSLTRVVVAMDFLEKRECTINLDPKRVPVHTICIISGGMMGGTIDVAVKTPDGQTYPLEGPIDGEDGSRYLLQHVPAHLIVGHGAISDCYQRNDSRLTVCIGERID